MELHSEGRQESNNLGEAQFPETTILQRVERGMSDLGLFCQRSLAEAQRFASCGDLLAYGGQRQHRPNI